MTKHHRGNVGMLHNAVQNALVDTLEAMGRKVKKEHKVPSLVVYGREWVVDVADITDAAHPIYYEIEPRPNQKIRKKIAAVAAHTNVDIIPIYYEHLDPDVKRSIIKLRKHLGALVI